MKTMKLIAALAIVSSCSAAIFAINGWNFQTYSTTMTNTGRPVVVDQKRFAGIETALFYAENTRMLYGDGAEMASALHSELKALDGGH